MIGYSIFGDSADTSDVLVGNVTLVSSWLDGEAYASTDPRRMLDERVENFKFRKLSKRTDWIVHKAMNSEVNT